MFRTRRSGTVADAFGSRMLGGCWVGGGDSAGMVDLHRRLGTARRLAPGIGTATRRTVSQAGGKQSHLRGSVRAEVLTQVRQSEVDVATTNRLDEFSGDEAEAVLTRIVDIDV